jgi:pimeloyl-ACP methyl ester carboxylesterase
MAPKIIFLHGGPGFRDYLEPFFRPLKKDFECVFYDQLQGEKISIEDLVAQLDGFVSNSSDKVVLVGHSWGAVLATEYATRHPDKIAGLVLMSTGLKTEHWKDDYRKELSRLGLLNAKPEEIFLLPDELEDGTVLLGRIWKTFSEVTFDHLDNTYLGQYDLTARVRAIGCPILNIFGDRDVRFPARVAKAFREMNSAIIDFEVTNAGHFPFLKTRNCEMILELIRQTFLSGRRRST